MSIEVALTEKEALAVLRLLAPYLDRYKDVELDLKHAYEKIDLALLHYEETGTLVRIERLAKTSNKETR